MPIHRAQKNQFSLSFFIPFLLIINRYIHIIYGETNTNSLNEKKSNGGNGSKANDGVTSLVDTLDSKLVGGIPDQVSETVPEVESEGQSSDTLDGELSSKGRPPKAAAKEAESTW